MLWLLIAIPAGVLVFCAVLLLFTNTKEQMIRRRLSVLAKDAEIDGIHDEVMKEKHRRALPSGSRFISQKFEEDLAMAGIKLSAREYLTAWIGTTIAPMLLLLLFQRSIVAALAAGIIGFVIPPALVKRAQQKRQQLFSRQLGESLIVMRNCLKSGYSFLQTLESISADMQPPISQEFARVLREVHYGVKLDEALNHMVIRVQNKDLEMLVSAVVIANQVGGNLSDIMDNISATIKDRIKIRDDVRILSAQGRMSGLIIGLLPVAILLLFMLVNPAYIEGFVASTLGKIMLAIGAVMEFIGFYFINKIVDLKY